MIGPPENGFKRALTEGKEMDGLAVVDVISRWFPGKFTCFPLRVAHTITAYPAKT
jgi:hypothetical protein